MDLSVENLIIGAGLSGIATAYFLGDNYLLVERDDTPGGYCRTIKNERYVWDYAGHFYHFQTEKYKELFLSLVKEEEIIRQKKNTKIFYKGQLIDYPFQVNIDQLEKGEFIECLYDLYFREQKTDYEDFLGMLYSKFGRAIVEKFLRPYNEKLYATDLSTLDKNAMGRFFPFADFDAVMRNMGGQKTSTYNDEFMYLKKGTGYFIDRFFETLNRDKVLFNTSVVKINKNSKIAYLNDGRRVSYKNLINTVPFNVFLRMLGDAEFDAFSDKLSYNKVLVLNLGFDGPSPKYRSEHWVYFPDKSLNFYRIGFYNNILMQDELSVYVEIGLPKNCGEIDYDKECEDALRGMKEVGIINDDLKLVDKNILLMDPAYVHIVSEDEAKVGEIMNGLERDGIYSIGRYGKWTYNSMEDCMQLADDLVCRIKQNKLDE